MTRTIINYKKLRKFTKARRLSNGTMKYIFIPEPEYQLPHLYPPVPIIHFEGSKTNYLKHMREWIKYSIRMRQYLTLPSKGHITWEDYPNQPMGLLEQGDELMSNQLQNKYKSIFSNYPKK